MYIKNLRVNDFRCLVDMSITADPGLNVIVGDNGSGKSSVLEAVFFLSRVKTFRPGTLAQLISRGARELSVFASFQTPAGPMTAGAAYAEGNTRMRIGQENASTFDLVTALPVQLIDPGIHRVSEEGASERRKFLDWSVFHVERGFYACWKRYRRTLQQRNKALKGGDPISLAPLWDADLAAAADTLHQYRKNHAERVAHLFSLYCGRYLERTDITLMYQKGWSGDVSLKETLASDLEGDMKAGFTRHGPHRADFKLRAGQSELKRVASRGEQKALIILLSTAQAEVITLETADKPVLLLDDFAAELGTRLRRQIADALASLDIQCFITALDTALVPQALANGKMFHVEHGDVKPMV